MHFSRGSCLFLKIHDTKNCVRLRTTTTTTNFSNSTGTLETKRNRISNIGEWKRIILIHPPWNYRARFPSNLKTSVVNLKRNTNVHPAPRCNWKFKRKYSKRKRKKKRKEKKSGNRNMLFYSRIYIIYRSFDSFLWKNNGTRWKKNYRGKIKWNFILKLSFF